MSYLTGHWTYNPYLIVALALAVWTEVGLARLSRLPGPAAPEPGTSRSRRRRSVLLYAGLIVLLLAVESPIAYWSYDYFFVHMIQHLLLMFAAPSLIVAGAPWDALRCALTGRTASRPENQPLPAVRAALGHPYVGVALFSAVMVFWHLPWPFDLAERNQLVHLWLMYPSFLIAGVLFWRQFIASPPRRIAMSPLAQITSLLATNCVMWVLAMAMGFLTSSSWYSVYNHRPGVTLPAFADQQIGAGILWICGDFWAIPTMIFVIRRLMAEDGSISASVDRLLGRGSGRYNWANRG